MSFHVNENIFRLQVPENDLVIVQVFKTQQQLAHVELCKLLWEAALLNQVEKQLAASAEIHDEEEFLFTSERPV